jgi:hypothetical protein
MIITIKIESCGFYGLLSTYYINSIRIEKVSGMLRQSKGDTSLKYPRYIVKVSLIHCRRKAVTFNPVARRSVLKMNVLLGVTSC